MIEEYIVMNRIPTVDEYIRLCTVVGWKDYMNFEVAEESLDRSIFGVVVEHRNEAIGMGRIVGDGRIYFYIQDIAVDERHQGRGVGKMIMEAITGYLKENAPDKAFVGLFASQGKETFYKHYGLDQHEGMTGMFGVVEQHEIW